MSRDERSLATGLTDPAVPRVLADGELEILGLLPRSSNYTFLVRAVDVDGTDCLAVYKPRRGEIPLWDFPEGTLCRREVAAYRVARELGWPRVPPTLLREGPEGIGSVQLFMEFDPEQHYFTLQHRHPDTFRDVALFDVVINNADRKAGHCLLGTDGEVFLIDHGTCFNQEAKLRSVIWDYMGEPIPAARVGDLEDLLTSMRDGPLDIELAELLSPEEREAMRRRLSELIDRGTFPEPGDERPYPWPPI